MYTYLVGSSTLAAAVVEDSDDGRAARPVAGSGGGIGTEKGSDHGSRSARLENLAAASLHGHHRGESRGTADNSQDCVC